MDELRAIIAADTLTLSTHIQLETLFILGYKRCNIGTVRELSLNNFGHIFTLIEEENLKIMITVSRTKILEHITDIEKNMSTDWPNIFEVVSKILQRNANMTSSLSFQLLKVSSLPPNPMSNSNIRYSPERLCG
ncbi:hypothetical protein CEXT_121421 [Caerostris extrusa]|uniref:Uncharacterized protein n=1 Tax=Caerostris extrusa TaxID=172846 RepID=A0AAV4RN08_CAEEX|nr:hypothetical protein CEXT_121421 [Caerostris extrusa]